jgi:hypothetical protein
MKTRISSSGRVFLMAMVALLLVGMTPTPLTARPKAKKDFSVMYPAVKGTRLDSCKTCHAKMPKLNAYGLSLKKVKLDFSAVEQLDSDGDTVLNVDEIRMLTNPGDPKEKPKEQEATN